jgi:hypothetical protein
MLADMDRAIMAALKGAGLDTFDALFYRTGAAEPVECTVTLDTLELTNEYGVTVVESGAQVGYLVADIGNPGIGDYFEFNGSRYTVENKEPTQDTSWRFAHCRVTQL